VAPFWGDFAVTVHDGQTNRVDGQLLAQDDRNRTYGDNHIAGGPQGDMIFGQRGLDTVQGDGSLFYDVRKAGRLSASGFHLDGAVIAPTDLGNAPLSLWARLEASAQSGNTSAQAPQSYEAPDDGDDYIEGGQDDDLIFGNLGQDDIIGGNSSLFGLDTQASRADGSDLIFGGAATNISRNDLGDATLVNGRILNDVNAHSRDADTILGDNGNIYRLVDAAGPYLTLIYDQTPDEDGSRRGYLRSVVRATEWTGGTDGEDYTPGGPDFDPDNSLRNIGAADEIHGEAGDDTIYGLVGDDVIYGDGQDDDLIGGYGNDWISGGAGQDGVLGDDGRIYTSRNDGHAETLYGIAGLAQNELDVEIETSDSIQKAIINVSGALKKTAILMPSNVDQNGDPSYDAQTADDIIYGGLGDDFLHGGSGDDAISGAEALSQFHRAPSNPGRPRT
jgi:Ca2+-binding RTX toxin-like protein